MRTQYLYDDVTGACIAEFDENGDTQVEYTTNPLTGELISENHNGQEVYHRYDGGGNTRQTTDGAGNVLGEATYTAFGETVAESGDMKTTYRFRGRQGYSTDAVTGDVSKTSSDYSPPLGRRLSRSMANAFSGGNWYTGRLGRPIQTCTYRRRRLSQAECFYECANDCSRFLSSISPTPLHWLRYWACRRECYRTCQHLRGEKPVTPHCVVGALECIGVIEDIGAGNR